MENCCTKPYSVTPMSNPTIDTSLYREVKTVHEFLDRHGIKREERSKRLSLFERLSDLEDQINNAFEIEKETKEAHRVIDTHKVENGHFILRQDSEGREKSLVYRLQEVLLHQALLRNKMDHLLDLYGVTKEEKETLTMRIDKALHKGKTMLNPNIDPSLYWEGKKNIKGSEVWSQHIDEMLDKAYHHTTHYNSVHAKRDREVLTLLIKAMNKCVLYEAEKTSVK